MVSDPEDRERKDDRLGRTTAVSLKALLGEGMDLDEPAERDATGVDRRARLRRRARLLRRPSK